MKEEIMQEIKEFIGITLKGFVTSGRWNNESYYNRIDELFLLWAKLNKITFNQTCEEFGIDHNDFSTGLHHKNKSQIVIKYKSYFDGTEI